MIYVLCASYREFLDEVRRVAPDCNPMRDARYVRWPHDLANVEIRRADRVITCDSWSTLPGLLRAKVGIALADAERRGR